MNIVATINSILNQLKPFISTVALIFGFIAAWHGLAELFPPLAEQPGAACEQHRPAQQLLRDAEVGERRGLLLGPGGVHLRLGQQEVQHLHFHVMGGPRPWLRG